MEKIVLKEFKEIDVDRVYHIDYTITNGIKDDLAFLSECNGDSFDENIEEGEIYGSLSFYDSKDANEFLNWWVEECGLEIESQTIDQIAMDEGNTIVIQNHISIYLKR